MNTPKYIRPRQVIFDIETVPCIETGEKVLIEPNEIEEFAELKKRYPEAYDTAILKRIKKLTSTDKKDDNLVKFMFNKVVSISCLIREGNMYDEAADLTVISFPTVEKYSDINADLINDEATMIKDFFLGVGANGKVDEMPQLIGFYSKFFDLPVLCQRALVNQLQIPHVFNRPDKPWEGVDYINNFSDDHFDLAETFSSNNFLSKFKLNQICRAIGVPGKLDIDGSQVSEMYDKEQFKEIVQYCETDVFSTYLLFLHTLKMTNKISLSAFENELNSFWSLINAGMEEDYDHYEKFYDESARLANL